jgi:hypothetical protein
MSQLLRTVAFTKKPCLAYAMERPEHLESERCFVSLQLCSCTIVDIVSLVDCRYKCRKL